MKFRWPSFSQRTQMLGAAVTLVSRPAIAWPFAIRRNHEPVSMLFSDDTRRRNAGVNRIAANHRFRRVTPLRQPIAIDQNLSGLDTKRVNRSCHSKQCGLQDIDAVNLFDARLTNSNDTAAQNFSFELRASLGRETLAIIQPLDPAVAQDYRRCDNGPCQWTAPCLVNARNQMRHGG